jgi:hypothetical protein
MLRMGHHGVFGSEGHGYRVSRDADGFRRGPISAKLSAEPVL